MTQTRITPLFLILDMSRSLPLPLHRHIIPRSTSQRPPCNPAHFGVEITLKAVIKIDNFSKMGPSQLCTQCVHNFLIRKNLSKSDNIKKIVGNGFVVFFSTRFALISL